MAAYLKTMPFLKRLSVEQILLFVENQEFEIIHRSKDDIIEIDMLQTPKSNIYLLISGTIVMR